MQTDPLISEFVIEIRRFDEVEHEIEQIPDSQVVGSLELDFSQSLLCLFVVALLPYLFHSTVCLPFWAEVDGNRRRRTTATAARHLRSSRRWASCLGKIARCLPRCFTFECPSPAVDIYFTNHFHHRLLQPSGLPSRIIGLFLDYQAYQILLPYPPLSERRYYAARRHVVTLCVCPPSRLYHVSTARHISLGGEGNVLYPVLSSLVLL